MKRRSLASPRRRRSFSDGLPKLGPPAPSRRRLRLEPLESRLLLATNYLADSLDDAGDLYADAAPSVAPMLDVIDEVTVIAGAPLHVALNGFDADGDPLSFTATSSNPSLLETCIPEGNQSLRMSVENLGDMAFELFEGRAPRTTSRIIELASDGFYDDSIFHRVIEDFVIQGGDPTGTGSGGSGLEFDDEFHPDLMHTSAGVLSMAKARDDSNDTQFFITSGPTRHLDFNHSVFGFLTQGDDVREQIEIVATDDHDRPLDDVVISSMEVFTDVNNGVLMLSAPEGASGDVLVAVTVDDGAGGSETKTIEVHVVPDSPANNSRPYLLPVDELHTGADTAVSFQLEAVDVEGDAVFYVAWPLGDWGSFPNPDLQIDLDVVTGQGTVTPSGGAVGVHGILVGVNPLNYDEANGDYQFVPLLIAPPAPAEVVLLASTDTGASNSDGVTGLNNADGSSILGFRVSGTTAGAEVSVFADGVLMGQAIAGGDSVVVMTDGTTELSDGTHSITASQALRNQPVDVGNRRDTVTLSSPLSAPMDVTVDTVPPQFSSTPIETATERVLYVYDVETDDEPGGLVVYRLAQAPAGMWIDVSTGIISWIPQPGQGPSQSVTVVAGDVAGNEIQQAFSIQIEAAQAPVSTPGLYDPLTATFHLRNSNTAGEADTVFNYGPGYHRGWIALAGDFDGDGVDSVALYDPVHGGFHLKNTNSNPPGGADVIVQFGPALPWWQPIVGDWDGDGIDTVGLYDPFSAGFRLKNSNTSRGGADVVFSYGPGNPGTWKAIVGDWDGDGVDTIGLYDWLHAGFHLKNVNANPPGGADVVFSYGPINPLWRPLVGDFDGDGIDTVGLYDSSTSALHLKNVNANPPHGADAVFRFLAEDPVWHLPANVTWQPLMGDWDGPAVASSMTGASAANFPATTSAGGDAASIAAALATWDTAADSRDNESPTAPQPGLAEIDAYFGER